MWIKALEIIKNFSEPQIIDIGCGPGQFAEYLFDNGISKYQGIDFSSEAIEMAKKRNSQHGELFAVSNAYSSDIFDTSYNIVVLFEVLEHIEDDLKILERIRKGSNVLCSVPNFCSAGHLRWFETEMKIMQRYNRIMRIDKIYKFDVGVNNKIYLLSALKI